MATFYEDDPYHKCGGTDRYKCDTKCVTCVKAYYQKNRKEKLKKSSEYSKAPPEVYRKDSTKFRENNPERWAEIQADYRENNRAMLREKSGRTYFWHINDGSNDGQWGEEAPQGVVDAEVSASFVTATGGTVARSLADRPSDLGFSYD